METAHMPCCYALQLLHYAANHAVMSRTNIRLCIKTIINENSRLTGITSPLHLSAIKSGAKRRKGIGVSTPARPEADLFIIGGGINGCGIARDAAGRGLSVTLAEQGDLAQGTSSASTKLFHGGLRYLEFFEFGLVRKALEERETLLCAMPHISRPMRFVLPLSSEMRFESETPASRLLARLMPWLKGRRPDWMIRIGLFAYDFLGGRKILPGTATLDLRRDPAGAALEPRFRKA